MVAGVAGIVAITADDGGVPVAVVDDGQPDLLGAPMTDGDVPVEITPSPTATLERTEGITDGLALSSPTPTETLPESAMPTLPPVVPASEVPAVDVPAAEPAEVVATPEVPANTALPTSSTVPSPTAVPTLAASHARACFVYGHPGADGDTGARDNTSDHARSSSDTDTGARASTDQLGVHIPNLG